MQSRPPRKEVPKGKVFIWSVTICPLTPVSVVAWLWEACDEVFQSDLFPLCPPSVLDSIGCLIFGPIEQRWHLQRLFWTQAGSLPICCTWETSLEEGKDWQLFDCIWCLRSYTELPSTCLSVQSPQLFLLLLLLPRPSGVCVTGMWFGSSVIVTQETCKDSGYWLRSSLRTWIDILLVPWKQFPRGMAE